MASTLACGSLSLASCRARATRLLSRASHSASTSRPKRSSKGSAATSACCCWSVQACAIAGSLRMCSLSSVGVESIGPPLRVVVPATHVLVDGSEDERRRHGLERHTVETVLEDGVHMAIGARADGEGAGTGGLKPGGADPPAQTKQAETGAVALLGMRSIGEDHG